MSRTVRISKDKRADCGLDQAGVYFTKAGAEKLGHHVEHDLRRVVLSSHAVPVASPVRRNSHLPKMLSVRAAFNATGTEKSGELVGAAKQSAEREADPLAARVLNRRSRRCTARSG